MSARPRILFCSPCGPYPKASPERDPLDSFYYRNTLGQGLFQLRGWQSWHSLHYLAQNLPVDSVVLENPSPRRFRWELARGGHQALAIGFTVATVDRVLEMARWCRSRAPEVELILGGYGSAAFGQGDPRADELQALAHHVCPGEGLEFLRSWVRGRWGLEAVDPPRQDFLPVRNSLFRSRLCLFRQLVLVESLGCAGGCSFCATSAQFGRRRIPLADGRRLFQLLEEAAARHPRIQSALILGEDFLANRKTVEEFLACRRASRMAGRAPLLTVFSSVRSLRQWSIEQLLELGVGTLFIGVESFQEEILQSESLAKRTGDVEELFARLHAHGIHTLGSCVAGWDGQDLPGLREDLARYTALRPTFYQVVPLQALPGTPLWGRLKAEGRLSPERGASVHSVAEFSHQPSGLECSEALAEVASTYRALVAEGGPWPFRLAENLLAGLSTLDQPGNPVFMARRRLLLAQLRAVLPLALAARAFFHGPGFRRRWRDFLGRCRRQLPLATGLALLALPWLIPLLAAFHLFNQARHVLSPRGDQPETVRVEYMGAQPWPTGRRR